MKHPIGAGIGERGRLWGVLMANQHYYRLSLDAKIVACKSLCQPVPLHRRSPSSPKKPREVPCQSCGEPASSHLSSLRPASIGCCLPEQNHYSTLLIASLSKYLPVKSFSIVENCSKDHCREQQITAPCQLFRLHLSKHHHRRSSRLLQLIALDS